MTINNKFKQLADDFGFKIVPCIRARPNTKAKVENPVRIIDEIMNYNGIVENLEELHKKMSTITNEANSRICQLYKKMLTLVHGQYTFR
ncbi:hypothetical protein RBU49_03960 [Clostridium sp. MB40-C1]|uniref:hypothetical protein n=1 Tax=Clostridium sp. MB40-C1 TaxID=3070996 RepID=UPI0027E1FD68|nr:hypothetical protein [Clostridium sp. MB40-C1]WMJ82497.1 hypothetical protein RBU49_03960 [Clostridium sp. MB40-C1]